MLELGVNYNCFKSMEMLKGKTHTQNIWSILQEIAYFKFMNMKRRIFSHPSLGFTHWCSHIKFVTCSITTAFSSNVPSKCGLLILKTEFISVLRQEMAQDMQLHQAGPEIEYYSKHLV